MVDGHKYNSSSEYHRGATIFSFVCTKNAKTYNIKISNMSISRSVIKGKKRKFVKILLSNCHVVFGLINFNISTLTDKNE